MICRPGRVSRELFFPMRRKKVERIRFTPRRILLDGAGMRHPGRRPGAGLDFFPSRPIYYCRPEILHTASSNRACLHPHHTAHRRVHADDSEPAAFAMSLCKKERERKMGRVIRPDIDLDLHREDIALLRELAGKYHPRGMMLVERM